ncbi:PfkB family carbohydrate kinase [Draconibacterium sp. IB214405]|uniref:carbohydrate kinase family protein n=1 Tax=Draconibacterium sp. IB214405 TaxID=3097352 RepID=UPI002A15FB71|nr:PfkB family carbohydrate kinase [Draconibacterium sp. IB214405]MDX8340978.1 PfkB family carbohydrate kinase [Draconibacterium sp. IB214405]
MTKRIVAFGEVVWDILPNDKVLGGTPSNFVFRCNSLGEKGYLLSRVGDDELGNEALEELKKLGISDRNVQVDPVFKTGTVEVNFNENDEAVYHVASDVAFDHIEFSAEALKLVRKADCLVFGLLPQRFGLSKNTLRELLKESPDSVHFFDLKLFEHFFSRKVVTRLLKAANVVRIKDKEIDFLAEKLEIEYTSVEDFAQLLSEKYKIDIVLVTRGRTGVLALHSGEGFFFEPGYDLVVKDNVGSGMAFAAGFLHYYLNGESVKDALRFGNAVGALNTTKLGATSPFTKEDVLAFMTNTKQHQMSV